MKTDMYNVTYLITGKSDNLRMHAILNDKEEMIGWVFLHESVDIDEVNAQIRWNFKVRIKQ
jgi:hypothetical protein